MKFFSNLFAVVGVALFSAAAVVAQTPDQTIQAIQGVTDQSATLQVTVSQITITNIATTGPSIASGLHNLTSIVQGFVNSFTPPTSPAYADPDAQEVVNVLTTFVEVHQDLLNTIIGKHSLAAQFFLTAPIAAALRGLESAVDAFAFLLIGLIPTQQDPAQTQFDSLTVTFTQAISTYS